MFVSAAFDDDAERDMDDDADDADDTDRCTVMASRTASNWRMNESRTSPNAWVRRSNCCRAACDASAERKVTKLIGGGD